MKMTQKVYTTKVILLAEPSKNRRIPLDELKLVVLPERVG
jgi:hypothetical protein